MRPTCLDCAGKHLAQACVLLKETKTGYPTFRWFVIGHLAEAEEETVRDYPELANEIREYRTEWDADETTIIPFEDLLSKVEELLMEEAERSAVDPGDETAVIPRIAELAGATGAAGTGPDPVGEFGPTGPPEDETT